MKKNKSPFISILIMSCLIMTPVVSQNQTQDDPYDIRNKNILIVYGGWDGHKPDLFAERMAKWTKENGARVMVSDSLGVYTQETLMKEVDLIIQYWTTGEISENENKGLIKAIRNGTGLVGCHGGIGDSFRQNTNYQYMIGGQFVSHPGGNVNYSVQITDQSDEITQGIENFYIKNTEQYYMHVDPNVKVLASTTFTDEHDKWINGAVIPVVWKKYHDKGRIFYMSIGHHPKDFDHPSVWALLTRGIKWAVNSKYKDSEKWLSPVYPKE